MCSVLFFFKQKSFNFYLLFHPLVIFLHFSQIILLFVDLKIDFFLKIFVMLVCLFIVFPF